LFPGTDFPSATPLVLKGRLGGDAESATGGIPSAANSLGSPGTLTEPDCSRVKGRQQFIAIRPHSVQGQLAILPAKLAHLQELHLNPKLFPDLRQQTAFQRYEQVKLDYTSKNLKGWRLNKIPIKRRKSKWLFRIC
jgi:hypothetical protein